MPSSVSHVHTYRPGSETSRRSTHASTPSSGTQEATRERQSTPSCSTHETSSTAVPPGARCSGAPETTVLLAPSNTRPDSR